MQNRMMRVGIAVAGTLSVLALASGLAFAEGGHGRHAGFFQKMMGKHIEAALDAAQATPAQREKILEAKAEAVAVIKANHQGKGAMKAEALALFEADSFDVAKVAQLRAEQQERAKASGDAILKAVQVVHDTLSPAQRVAVANYIRSVHGSKQ